VSPLTAPTPAEAGHGRTSCYTHPRGGRKEGSGLSLAGRRWLRLAMPLVLAASLAAQRAEEPLYESGLVAPLDTLHNHASSLVELPGGDLLAVWYRGSGERTADDVEIVAARRPLNQTAWSQRFPLADTPNFPDTNPALLVDSRSRLWLIWPVIIANQWHTALLKYRITLDYPIPGAPPRWEHADNLLFIPRNFEERVQEVITPWLEKEKNEERRKYLERLLDRAGDKYFSRMGWMPRVHPLELPSGRILVPLYSDGYDFSIVAITDDFGETWASSEPILGAGAVQPSIVRRRDGVLVAYMRDNGPAPKRMLRSLSRDEGVTWSEARDTDIPNPGAGLEVIVLEDGTWAMVNNDTEKGRHSLAVWLSEDEGATWSWKRHLELDRRPEDAGSFHYPSLIQARDGSLHVTYSYFLNHLPEGAPRKTIKHARFNTAWVRQGDR
jgi:predicted neuraminidase